MHISEFRDFVPATQQTLTKEIKHGTASVTRDQTIKQILP